MGQAPRQVRLDTESLIFAGHSDYLFWHKAPPLRHRLCYVNVAKGYFLDFLLSLSPVWQGFLATPFTWSITAAGSCPCFFKSENGRTLDLMIGFSAGVMMAAFFWPLLVPAIALLIHLGAKSVFICAAGFISGGLFVMGGDAHLHRLPDLKKAGDSLRRPLLLFGAVTLHNIPEGMAIGVAFVSTAIGIEGATVLLALGIGLQNFPEGACVAMPLRKDGFSPLKSFLIGQASALVEPAAGIFRVLLAIKVQSALPLQLAFSAEVMIFVFCSELIPKSFKDNKTLAAAGFLTSFALMMILDIVLV